MKLLANNFILIVKIFYGELFNLKNPIKIRIFRILARFQISNKFINYYLKKEKMKK